MSAMTDELRDDEKARLNLTVGNVSFWTDRLIEARKENIKSQQALGEIIEKIEAMLAKSRNEQDTDDLRCIIGVLEIASKHRKGGSNV